MVEHQRCQVIGVFVVLLVVRFVHRRVVAQSVHRRKEEVRKDSHTEQQRNISYRFDTHRAYVEGGHHDDRVVEIPLTEEHREAPQRCTQDHFHWNAVGGTESKIKQAQRKCKCISLNCEHGGGDGVVGVEEASSADQA